MDRTLFLICFGSYLVGLILFGWWTTRRKQSGEEFLLGGRSLSLFLTLGTTVATMVGTGSSMGAVGLAYRAGWKGMLYGLGGGLGILLLAWLFAPVRNFRFVTMAEELCSYVGANRLFRTLLSVLIYFASIGWIGVHILGGALYLHYVTDIPLLFAKLIIALGFGIYATLGGYRAVVWTDTLQAIVLFAGFLVTALVSLSMLGGIDAVIDLASTLPRTAEGAGEVVPGPAWLTSVSLVLVIAVGVLGTPSFRQRIYSGNSVGDVRKAFVITAALAIGFAVFPAIIGMAAYAQNPKLSPADMAFPYMATEVLPMGIGIVVLLAGLSATMSSASSDAIAACTTVVGDLWPAVTGAPPRKERVVFWSRIALLLTMLFAFGLTLLTDQIITYIKTMIPLLLAGMCVSSVCGRLWPRYNLPGAVASLVLAPVTSGLLLANPTWLAFWGSTVIPTLCVSTVGGVLVSLVTRADSVTDAEAIARLDREREDLF